MNVAGIDLNIWRCIVGVHATADSAMRNAIRLQTRATGADVMHADLDRKVRDMLDAPTGTVVPTDRICAAILDDVMMRGQLQPDGAVLAPPITLAEWKAGARPQPWNRHGYFKQGHAAFIALCAWCCGMDSIAKLITQHIESEQERGTAQMIAGLWMAGARSGSPELDPENGWSGHWAYCAQTIPFEDHTQLWNTVCMHTLGRTYAYGLALSGIDRVVKVNDGLVPYCASRRSGRPDFGRFAVLYSTEETAAAALLLEAAGPEWSATAQMCRGRLAELELRDDAWNRTRRWPKWVDEWGSAHWPLADQSDPQLLRGAEPARMTRDRKLSIRGGYESDTEQPRQVMGYGKAQS